MRRAVAGAHDFHGVRANGNRNGAWLAKLIRTLREPPHVVRCHDVDAGQALFFDDQPVDAGIDAVFRVLRDDDARSDHRASVKDRRHRDR
jgi:hypothetical protein